MITINTIPFKTKKELEDHVRYLLQINEAQTIGQMHDDYQFLDELITRHPEYETKVYGYVEEFRVVRNFGGHIALNFMDEQHTWKDISWRKCVTGRSKSSKARLLGALRNAISEDVFNYKIDNFAVGKKCPLCKNKMPSKNECHVDHKTKPFRDIVEGFIAKQKKLPKNFKSLGLHLSEAFLDEDIVFKKDWIRFHRENADYQLLCAKCNIAKK